MSESIVFKHKIASFLWVLINYPESIDKFMDWLYKDKNDIYSELESYAYLRINKIASRYCLTDYLSETQTNETVEYFLECLCDVDSDILRNVRKKNYLDYFEDNDSTPEFNTLLDKIYFELEKTAIRLDKEWTTLENGYLATCILSILEKKADPDVVDRIGFGHDLNKRLKLLANSSDNQTKIYEIHKNRSYSAFEYNKSRGTSILKGEKFVPVQYISDSQAKEFKNLSDKLQKAREDIEHCNADELKNKEIIFQNCKDKFDKMKKELNEIVNSRKFFRILPDISKEEKEREKEENKRVKKKKRVKAYNKNLTENIVDLLRTQPTKYYFERNKISSYLYNPENIISLDTSNKDDEDDNSLDIPVNSTQDYDSVLEEISEFVQEEILDFHSEGISEKQKQIKRDTLLAGLAEYAILYEELFVKDDFLAEDYYLLHPEKTKKKGEYKLEEKILVKNFLNKVAYSELNNSGPITEGTARKRIEDFRDMIKDIIEPYGEITRKTKIEISRVIIQELLSFYRDIAKE